MIDSSTPPPPHDEWSGVKGYHRYYQTTFPPFDKKSLLRNQFSDSGAFESLMAFDIFFFLFPFPFFSPADFLLSPPGVLFEYWTIVVPLNARESFSKPRATIPLLAASCPDFYIPFRGYATLPCF